MLKFIVLLVIIQQALASSNCSKGPSYWCKTIQNANECNAFKHCLQTIWSKDNTYLKPSISKKCSSCVNCLYSSTKSCPNVALYREEINELYENDLPSESICQLIDQCEETNTVASECEQKNKCDSLEMASNCDSISECMNQWKVKSKKQLRPIESAKSGLESKEVGEEKSCGFCIYIFTKIQTVIQQNSTEIDLSEYLTSACKLLPDAELSKKCDEQVNTYLSYIFDLLRDNCDPGVICHVLQICKDKYVEDRKIDLSKVNIQIVNYEKTIIKSPFNQMKKYSSDSKQMVLKMSATNGMACELCNIIFSAAQYLIENEVDSAKVINFIDKNLCIRLGSYNETCTKYLENDGKLVIEFLEKNVKPSFLCGEAGLCIKSQITLANEHPFDIKVRNPSNCKKCKFAMEHAKNMLAKNYKQIEVLASINKDLCQNTGDMKYLCKTTIDMHSEIILELIEQEIKSYQICIMFGTCEDEAESTKQNNALSYNTQRPEGVQSEESPKCVLCQFVLKALDKYITKNSTEMEITSALEEICQNAVPSHYKEKCVQLVDTYTQTIIFLIAKEVPTEAICGMIGVCDISVEDYDDIKEEGCNICEYVFEQIQANVVQNSTKHDVLVAMDHVCYITIPLKYKEQCLKIAQNYTDSVFFILEQQVTPEYICELMSLCPQTPNKTEIIELKKDIELFKERLEENLFDACEGCTLMFELLQEHVTANTTKHEVLVALDHICYLGVPKQYREQCLKVVKNYTESAFYILGNKATPEYICEVINACGDSSELQKSVSLEMATIKNDFSALKDDKCDICVFVFTTLQKHLTADSTKHDVLIALDHICYVGAPKKFQEQCLGIIKSYVDSGFDVLVNKNIPGYVCQNLNVCPQKITELPSSLTLEMATIKNDFSALKDDKCDICVFVFTTLQKHLTADSTKHDVLIALDHICYVGAPKKFQEQCLGIIKSYVDSGFDVLVNKNIPGYVCQNLNVCPQSSKKILFGSKQLYKHKLIHQKLEKTRPLADLQKAKLVKKVSKDLNIFELDYKADNLECTLCVYAAQLTKTYLGKNLTEAEIEQELQLVCNYFPVKLKGECESFVAEYGPYIIKLVVSDVDPRVICSDLHLCASKSNKIVHYFLDHNKKSVKN